MISGQKKLTIGAALVALFLALVLLNFHGITNLDISLEAGDAPLYHVSQVKKMLDNGHLSSASPAVGLGGQGPILIGDFTAVFYRFLPESKVEESIMAFAVFMICIFFFLFLKERGYRGLSSLTGALALGLSVVLLSIAKAGHTGKFTGIAYIAGAMWLMGRCINGKGWIWSLWAGFFSGLALAQARDLSLLILLGVGVFWIRELIMHSREKKRFVHTLLVNYIMAGIVALIVMWPVMKILVPKGHDDDKSHAAVPMDDARQKWEWATQWSLPSDELPKLICPSYCGW
ncbi:hypothetical protein C4588_01950, partial [Candidatus Parcubacteria bacterium]